MAGITLILAIIHLISAVIFSVPASLDIIGSRITPPIVHNF